MLLSVACGLAIMLAGAAFLFQLASQDDLDPPLAIGDSAEVGDMVVTVSAGSDLGAGRYLVAVTIGGTADEQPAEDFRLIAAGRRAPFVDTTCRPTDDTDQRCELTFDTSVADGMSRVLFYERGDRQARWVLGVWFLLQFLTSPNSGVAWSAHVGGDQGGGLGRGRRRACLVRCPRTRRGPLARRCSRVSLDHDRCVSS